ATPEVGGRGAARRVARACEVELRGLLEVKERVERAVVREAVARELLARRLVHALFLVRASELRDFEPLRLLQEVFGDDRVVRPRREVVHVVAGATRGDAAVERLVFEEALVGGRSRLRLVRVRGVGERLYERLEGGNLLVREQPRPAEGRDESAVEVFESGTVAAPVQRLVANDAAHTLRRHRPFHLMVWRRAG